MIRCKLIEVEAESEEWHGLRRGRITASRMGDVLAGRDTLRYKDYRLELVQGLMGIPRDEDRARWFEHGKAFEPHIRDAWAYDLGYEVTNNVFCVHKDYDWLGCSPDGLVLPKHDIAIEIKAREKMSTYEDVIAKQRRLGKIASNYRPQVCAQAWIMGLPSIEYIEGWVMLEQRRVRRTVKTVPIDRALVEKMEGWCLELMHEVYTLANKDTAELAA